MNFTYRLRAWAATVSIVFNQSIHLGNAPYPYTLSETCFIRRHIKRYAIGRAIIDYIFEKFGEYDHCELSYEVGNAFRKRDQV